MALEALLSPRSRTLLLSLAFLASASAARAQTQPAQVSDSDRAAARELATQGLQLQQQGKFADALDRFDRAQALFSAPTHLLHIAECEAALGKLVEAAETYRMLVRTELKPGSPNAFVQAQQEGAAELAQVEPRIPSIRVIIRPRPVPGEKIYFDGDTQHPMSDALIGMQRPTDPGVHTVTLEAPGYAKADQKITLKEKETQDVAFNLGPAPAGGYYTPPPAPAQPAPQYAPPQQMYLPPPGPPPEREPARGGFMLGGSIGGLVPLGNAYQNTPLGNLAGAGAAVQINGGFRFAKRLYMGLTFEHGFLSAGSTLTASSPGGSPSIDSNYIGFDFAVISNPDGVGFFGKIGVGYRTLDGTVTNSDGTTTTSDLNGAEFTIGAGVHIKLGDWIRLIPGASVSIGQFSNSTSGYAFTPDTHEFFLLGVTALVDFSRKH
jgi:hypothetical protein